jgi:hypothetical protein
MECGYGGSPRQKQSLEIVIMKSFLNAVALAAILAAPITSFAQTEQPLSRAQVREQLVQLEKAGYTPGASDSYNYPENIEAAEARVAAPNSGSENSGYGSSLGSSSQSGQPVAK